MRDYLWLTRALKMIKPKLRGEESGSNRLIMGNA